MSRSSLLLKIENLRKYFPIRKGVFQRISHHVKAVDGVGFFIREGETLGLVGESGCGKSTTGRCINRLIEPTGGRISFLHDERLWDVTAADSEELKNVRRNIQIIFQDPFSSLDPRMPIRDIIAEPLRVNKFGNRKEQTNRVAELLQLVGLDAHGMYRYPHEFSGGQRQRIGIARALALSPRLIICDEPVSALDVSVQAQVLNLLEDLQTELVLTYLFIAHDLSVVEHISDRVMVMYLGKIVEIAEFQDIFETPQHPYTEALLRSIPVGDPRSGRRRLPLGGDVPNPADPPAGCNFHPRCPYAQDKCQQEEPRLAAVGDRPEHFVSCHFAEELRLSGYGEVTAMGGKSGRISGPC